MTSPNNVEPMIGCIVRSGRGMYMVQSCRKDSRSGKWITRLIDIAGDTTEKTIASELIQGVEWKPAAKEDYFVHRELCPLCSKPAGNSKPLFAVRQIFWDIFVRECEHCGMAYKESIPNADLLCHVYSSGYTHFASANCDAKELMAYRFRVRALGKPHGRHLDYGCGSGSFVLAALQAGWDSYGADPFLPQTTPAPKLAGRLTRIEASDPSALETLGQFDCISMWAVVEHLLHVRETFVGLKRLLKPGGILVWNSPNGVSLAAKRFGGAWGMATLVEHSQFCTPSAAKWLAASLGMKLHKLRNAGSPYPLGRAGLGYQGVSPLPCAVPIAEEERLAPQGPSPVVAQKRRPIDSVRSWAFGMANSSLSRHLTHMCRLGDHIQVVLKAV